MEHAYRALPMHLTDSNVTASHDKYLILLYTKPSQGIFESTLRHFPTGKTESIEITGEISRLNSYWSDSKCVSDGNAKKYCFCL